MDTLTMYRRLSRLPLGTKLFSKAVCTIALFFQH